MITNQNAVVMSFSKPSIAAVSDVDRRTRISNMTTIIPGEKLAVNIDDKNSKCTSETIVFLEIEIIVTNKKLVYVVVQFGFSIVFYAFRC